MLRCSCCNKSMITCDMILYKSWYWILCNLMNDIVIVFMIIKSVFYNIPDMCLSSIIHKLLTSIFMLHKSSQCNPVYRPIYRNTPTGGNDPQ